MAAEKKVTELKLDSFKPGQSVRCTVLRAPRTPDAISTVERLMRRDVASRRGLKRGQRLRRQNMVIYNRGNRDWVKRERVGKIVSTAKGQTWTMRYTPVVAADLRAVGSYLSVEAA